MELDAELIEQSIAKQYGVLPSAQGELSWEDWAKLVGGLMDDTPLGRVVSVRSESDPEVVRKMTPWQHRIRSEWSAHQAKKMAANYSPDELRSEMQSLERMIAQAFGGGVK